MPPSPEEVRRRVEERRRDKGSRLTGFAVRRAPAASLPAEDIVVQQREASVSPELEEPTASYAEEPSQHPIVRPPGQMYENEWLKCLSKVTLGDWLRHFTEDCPENRAVQAIVALLAVFGILLNVVSLLQVPLKLLGYLWRVATMIIQAGALLGHLKNLKFAIVATSWVVTAMRSYNSLSIDAQAGPPVRSMLPSSWKADRMDFYAAVARDIDYITLGPVIDEALPPICTSINEDLVAANRSTLLVVEFEYSLASHAVSQVSSRIDQCNPIDLHPRGPEDLASAFTESERRANTTLERLSTTISDAKKAYNATQSCIIDLEKPSELLRKQMKDPKKWSHDSASPWIRKLPQYENAISYHHSQATFIKSFEATLQREMAMWVDYRMEIRDLNERFVEGWVASQDALSGDSYSDLANRWCSVSTTAFGEFYSQLCKQVLGEEHI